MKILIFFLAVLFSVSLISCDTDEPESPIHLSSTIIEMEGEGGEAEVSITGEEWKVVEVINLNANVHLFGNTYSVNGEPIQNNKPLRLDGLGRMELEGSNRGFKIVRSTPTSLEIVLKENSTGEDFHFMILIESKGQQKEITVKQKKSQGYRFGAIAFALGKTDGDSIYTRKGNSYEFNLQSSLDFTFSPINGIDIHRKFFFESPEKDAFVWLEKDSVMVELPSAIYNNEIYFAGEKAFYSNAIITEEHNFKDLTEEVTLPSGKSKFSTEIEYRKRIISYTIQLINNRTLEEKSIEGKWIEYTPTGQYSIEFE